MEACGAAEQRGATAMSVAKIGGDVFETWCDMFEATSLSRPDERWTFTDAAGHVHRWHEVGNPQPMTTYRPEWAYEVPTLKYVVDETGIDEDGYEYERGHSECVVCGEHVTPRRKPDETTQMIPGCRWYR